MKAMNKSRLAILRRQMVEMIAIHADLASDEIGKALLDERVMAAMREVPRHLFVPAPLRPMPTRTCPCQSGSIRRSRSPSLWRS